jgi:hypothetical protein
MDGNLNELRQFVREHRVCWHTYPVTVLHRGEQIQVGYEVELSAVHGTARGTLHADSPECHHLFGWLKRLADLIVPDWPRHEIAPFDHSVHLEGSRGWEPEVVLRLRIFHRDDYFTSVETCEKCLHDEPGSVARCLTEVEESLSTLGAHKGSWASNWA